MAFVPNLGVVLRRTVDVEKGRDRRWARHNKGEMKLTFNLTDEAGDFIVSLAVMMGTALIAILT